MLDIGIDSKQQKKRCYLQLQLRSSTSAAVNLSSLTSIAITALPDTRQQICVVLLLRCVVLKFGIGATP